MNKSKKEDLLKLADEYERYCKANLRALRINVMLSLFCKFYKPTLIDKIKKLFNGLIKNLKEQNKCLLNKR